MTESIKAVHSLRIARKLMHKGFPLLDIEPARKYKTGLVFIFADTIELNNAFTKILGGSSDEKQPADQLRNTNERGN